MAGGWLGRYSDPNPIKRTPLEKFKAHGFTIFFLGVSAAATVWFWRSFVFSEPVKDKDSVSFSTASQDTLDKLRKINESRKK